ncbi:hypothetical protein [Salinigranum marinum]|uniref:hypothetical protein n=1 Tax=Salinigranum marinum TaxID=1515595 RepID=UPI002989D8A5|nr:hypothetical protein [Salinigranum marinum]
MADDHTIGETRTVAERRLTDGDATVTVRKLVSKGERLAIDSGDARVSLDALLLEGLSWQRDRAAVDDLLGSDTAVATDPAATADGDTEQPVVTAEADGALSVSSEYSHVFVRDVTTPAGDALAITTPGRGTSITLGVQSLRVLARVEDTYVFSVWFQTPFGPEDTAVEGPL